MTDERRGPGRPRKPPEDYTTTGADPVLRDETGKYSPADEVSAGLSLEDVNRILARHIAEGMQVSIDNDDHWQLEMPYMYYNKGARPNRQSFKSSGSVYITEKALFFAAEALYGNAQVTQNNSMIAAASRRPAYTGLGEALDKNGDRLVL